MLQLKSGLAYHSLSLSRKAVTTSFSDLPREILDIILAFLYWESGGRLHSILPASRTCRRFRSAALPLLFESISCVIRRTRLEIPHPSFPKLASQPRLLQHVKTLTLQKTLLLCHPAAAVEDIKHDLVVLENALKHMTQLQQLRLRCSLPTAVDVLRLLQSRKDVPPIIINQIPTAFTRTTVEHLRSRLHLLGGRIAALTRLCMGNESLVPPTSVGPGSPVQLAALDISIRESHRDICYGDPILDSTLAVFPFSLSNLTELWLGRHVLERADFLWKSLDSSIPWPRLRRLRISGFRHHIRLREVMSSLVAIEDLALMAYEPSSFHTNCPYGGPTPAIYMDSNYPCFQVDFASLPNLRSLEIEGICSHVPIQNLVGPGLRALKLHKSDFRLSVINSKSQRSPSDLIVAAQLAPRIQKLELDIGHIENLWHPTAIPGLDVDPELYSFLAAFAKFEHLKELRLFPPFAAKEDMNSVRQAQGLPQFRQPLSDELAIRMFNYIRNRCSGLVLFAVSVTPLGIITFADFSPMNWEVRPWGQRNLLTTRQWGENYELRQIWVGERRLTMETKRDTYRKYHIPPPEPWLLDPYSQA